MLTEWKSLFSVPTRTLYLTTQRRISVSLAALTASLFGVGSFVAQLAGGELADRVGRRLTLLINLMAAGLLTILSDHEKINAFFLRRIMGQVNPNKWPK